jgi:hypothetical protein
MKTEERIQGDPRSLSNLFYYELYDGAGALLLKGDQAVIVRHDICFDWRNLHEVFEVRNFSVSHPYFGWQARVPRIDVFVRLKNHRLWHAFSSYPSNEQFFTIERGGRVIFDSRRDVPWPTAPEAN